MKKLGFLFGVIILWNNFRQLILLDNRNDPFRLLESNFVVWYIFNTLEIYCSLIDLVDICGKHNSYITCVHSTSCKIFQNKRARPTTVLLVMIKNQL